MTSRAYLLDEHLVGEALADLAAIGDDVAGPRLKSLRNALASQQVVDLAAGAQLMSDPVAGEGVNVEVRIGRTHFGPLRKPGAVGAPSPAQSWGHNDRTIVAAILQAALDNIHEANANDRGNV